VHEIADSWVDNAPAGLGLVTIVQPVPFHRSINVPVALEPEELPTAKQLVVLVHDTATSWLFDAPAGLGLATIAQVVPFHRCINVRMTFALLYFPTAKQFVALLHETAES
jgi:hypothetical protein